MNTERKSIFGELMHYVIPTTLSLLSFSLATFFDNMFVTNGIGAYALPALSISTPYMCMLYCISLVLGSGTNVVASILQGQGKPGEASQAFTQTLVVQIAVSTAIMIVSLCNLERLAYLLGATETNYPYVSAYLRLIVVCTPFFMLSYYFETMTQAHGKPGYSPIVCGSCAAFAVALEFVLIFVLRFDVAGAAISMSASQTLCTLIYLAVFLFGKGGRLHFCKFRFQPKTLLRVLRNGISGGTGELSLAVVAILFNRLLGAYAGDKGILGFSVVSSINVVISNVFFGIALGAQTLCGYYYGKDGVTGCRPTLRCTILVAAAFSALACALTTFFARPITLLYLNGEAESTIAYAANAVRMYGFSFLLMGVNIAASNYFAAIERAAISWVISLGRGLVLISILLPTFAGLFGDQGVWCAPVVNEAAILLIAVILYLRQGCAGKAARPADAEGQKNLCG